MKKLVVISIIGILLVGLAALGFNLYGRYRHPLNQPLVLQPLTTATMSRQLADLPASPVPTETQGANSSAGYLCGQGGVYTLLILGSDAADRRGHPGADLTRMARIDFSQEKVNIFAFSRDLWVSVDRLGFEDPAPTNIILGETYYLAYERSTHMDDSARMVDGTQAMAQMVLDNFGVQSDHYLALDLTRLPALIDTIGGLPIVIPERTTDPWIGTIIEAGPQVLDGKQLVAYARAIPDSDFARIQRSNIILDGLRQKLLDPSVWIRLPSLYEQFKQFLVTDLSPQEITNLICLLKKVPIDEIVMEQVKPEWTSPGPSGSLLWDKDQVTAALERLDLLPEGR